MVHAIDSCEVTDAANVSSYSTRGFAGIGGGIGMPRLA